MEFSTKALDWSAAGKNGFLATKTDCLVIGVFEGQNLSAAAKALDMATKGLVSRLIKLGDFEGKAGTCTLQHDIAGIGAARVLLVGLGKEAAFGDKAFADAARAALAALAGTSAANIVWCLTEHPARDRDIPWGVQLTTMLMREAAYRFADRHPALKSKRDKNTRGLRKVVLTTDAASAKAAATAAMRGAAIASGMDLAKDLGNLPPNICTPTYLGDTARGIAKAYKLKVEVLGRKQLEALKMGSFLAVAKGTEEPPQFIVLQYNGAAGLAKSRQAPVVLVGKGITFDSGGISLKPGEGMDEMKYDMCGAASVLGTIQAAAEMKLKLNVVAIVPTCENMPSGRATKPGDVVTSMSGQTIEVLNTDAEGRLILCDALTYAERFKPAAVVDVATLTGACIIALGHVNSGLYARSDALAEELLKAGKTMLDTAWRMPLDDAYQEQLHSNFADIANIGGRPAGSVTAACFLARFTEKYDWAHLDIAGTAWKSGGKAKGATGRPVPLLTEFLIQRAG
ncbi:leucyl aminopeptidase [Imbroritus primus]|uniref:Leucyl aminopeptidase n=1 Tax=Imbroritus primus TaxID=3058603 RepID=A0ACD3SKL0_9BURK|nr:leucyl aminopeptidase [Burkholderiaceae bacterium PBA]